MADQVIKKNTGKKGNQALIDPVYQKFTRGILRAISSTDFYEFFMDAISKADNEFQFSNRKLEKAVDLKWVEAVEKALPAIQNIIASPRNVIREEELIVNAALAKKVGSDVVRHLSQHAGMVEDFNEDSGDVRPTKVMQKLREDTEELYENRLVFTTMEMAFHFVKIRHDALFEAMSDEYGAKLRINSNMESATEMVHMDMFLHIKETESAFDADERNSDILNRISRLYRLLANYMNSKFAQQMSKVLRVKGTIVKTNVLKKNPDYHKVAVLFEFLRGYSDIGYSIRVIEQNPQINETFQRDIFHNIMFNYMILKGYLEDDSDRVVPTKPKEKRRALKPKFIHEIIEELTEDYDLPDVEIRKVLIEELTKEQLMKEEAEERRRLVEEQQKRKKEEEERIRQEKEAERERIRKEKEAEKERIRQEKEAEKQRQLHERMLREAEDRRRSNIFRKELEKFAENKADQVEARRKAWAKFEQEKQDFADAAQLVEEAEQRKLEELERQRKRQQEERERIAREKQIQLELLRQERERIRLEEERKKEEARLAEERRLEQERLEKERLEQERIEQENARYRALLAVHIGQLEAYTAALPARRKLRQEYNEQLLAEKRRIEEERRQRQQARAGQLR